MTIDITQLDAVAWREAAHQHSARALIDTALERIYRRNPLCNAFTVILAEQARAEADRLDSDTSNPGPLFGVPVAIKEEVDVAGCVTTFGTMANQTPKTADSDIVARLRAAGAIIIGKTAMPAFGAFPFTESDATGVTRNPHNPLYTPGGSAVAVADGMVPVAIGGDGGGSIRIPAAHCGLVGLKPRRGVIPTAPYKDLWCELGTAGALTRTVRDTQLMFTVISDERIETNRTPATWKIAVDYTPQSLLTPLSSEHRTAVESMEKRLRDAGHDVERVHLRAKDPTLLFMIQFLAGIRHEIEGLDNPDRIEARHKRTRALGFWVTPRVEKWAREASHRYGDELEKYFDRYDVILTPTVASGPSKAGRLMRMGTVAAQIASLPSVAYTAKWNVSGHPAIHVPVSRNAQGLPRGVQFIASQRSTERGERVLVELATEVMER